MTVGHKKGNQKKECIAEVLDVRSTTKRSSQQIFFLTTGVLFFYFCLFYIYI